MEAGVGGAAAVAAPPPPGGSTADLRALRAALAGAGYDGPRIRDSLHVATEMISRGLDLAVHERRLAAVEQPLAGLIRLLLLGLDVAEAEVAPLDAELLVRVGVAEDAEGMLRPRLRIVPHDDLLLAADLPDRHDADHVAGVHRPSTTLAALTVRRPVQSALDVGTGCGLQALLAAKHAEHVVATDVNERALAFAEFTARLNGVDNIEFRAGSFLEPVHGERFDLIVSNPPYVISPETALIFRDSGKPGDTVSGDLVTELPAHLAEGGYGTVMVSWIAGEDALERPRSWLEGSGCDALIVHTGTDDALGTAAAWNRAAGTETEGYAERLDAWLEYYRELGAESIGYGTIVMRRRSGGRNWVRTAELPADRLHTASDHLQRMFAAPDLLDTVLDIPLVLADGTYVDRTVRLDDGNWTFVTSAVRLETGIGFGVNLDHYGAVLIAAFDGKAPLRARLGELARELGAPEAEFVAFAERLARHLVEHGIAVPSPAQK
ncbi:MAG TPA: methyltransferase [Gaiellaceae bacterium]